MPTNNFLKNKNQYKNKGKMKYSSKNYLNPFFQHKKSAINFRPRKIILLSVFLLIFTGMIILFYAKYFQLKNIKIIGRQQITERTIEKIIWDDLNKNKFSLYPNKNLFILNSTTLKNKILESYNLNRINISKKFPDSLKIEITEKKPAIAWSEDDKYYFIDEAGNVIRETSVLEINTSEYPLIKNNTNKKITERKVGADHNYLDYSRVLFELFSGQKKDFPIKDFEIKSDYLLSVSLLNGPEIMFNTNNDIKRQFEKLVILKREKLKDDFVKKTYIDVGIGDSIYIR